MSHPSISVLLPVWTGVDYVEDTIKSIQAQTMTDWEMLVMGDPDCDPRFKEITNKYATLDPRILWIENEIHLGLAEKLNWGITLAKGKYIARVDADDPCYSQRFEKQYQYLETHCEIDFLSSQAQCISPNRCTITTLPTKPEDVHTEMLFSCSLCHSSLMFRRELLISNGWHYPTDEPQEDYALWLSLLNKATFANLDETLLDRIVGYGTSITSIRKEEISFRSSEIIAKSIQTYFGIDIQKYPENRFSYSFEGQHSMKIDEMCDWIVDSTEILLEMESLNRKHRMFDDNSLAQTLRKRWNWMLEGWLVPDMSDVCAVLPFLTEESSCTLSEELLIALGQRGALLDKSASLANVLTIVRERSAQYARGISDIVYSFPKVVVFGVGYYCDKFFDDDPNASQLFELVAFCDNNRNKAGQLKLARCVIAPDSLTDILYDYILIASHDYYSNIRTQLINLGVRSDRIVPLEIFRMHKDYLCK